MQVQLIQQSDQQWVLVNSENNLNLMSNTADIQTSENPLEVDLINGLKKKRKACDCPNCIKYKQSGAPKDDAAKKRTHKCHKCAKEYNKTSHLRAHLRGHDNYRPYVCDFKTCGKSFTRSDELKRHKRIHNDDRNFPCLICKKKFLRSDHLSKHLLVHNKASSKSMGQEMKLNQEQMNKIFDDQNLNVNSASSVASSVEESAQMIS